jgi:hypothetical protein
MYTTILNPNASVSLGILLHAAGLHVQGGVLGGGPLEPGDLVVDGNEAGKGDTEGVVDPRGDGVKGPRQSVDGPGVIVVAELWSSLSYGCCPGQESLLRFPGLCEG